MLCAEDLVPRRPVVSCRFEDESGGALFNIGPLEINNTMFKENTAADGGLAVMNEQAPLDLWNVSFDGNMLSCDPDQYLDLDHVRTAHI